MKPKVFFFLILVPFIAFSQKNEGLIRGFFKASVPEKKWALAHPFIAAKAWKISKEALRVTDEIKKDTAFDGDADGGQVDAFRHTFWMALLAQKINPKKAYKLGAAHEKGNYIDFKKGRIEEGSIPDSIAGEMDFRNNDIGISIGKTNKTATEEQLILLVKKAILKGDVWIINKDKKRNSLDCKDNILRKEEFWSKWNNPRCLVKSDRRKR
ncbi:MAG: hypothetical protein HY958_01975 [Bacteroidia bacterium]|nr:hypothetical protein [Bacteroidia bacterium]